MIEQMSQAIEASPTPDELMDEYRAKLGQVLDTLLGKQAEDDFAGAASSHLEKTRLGSGFFAGSVLTKYREMLLADPGIADLRLQMTEFGGERINGPLDEMVGEGESGGLGGFDAGGMIVAAELYRAEMGVVIEALKARGLGEYAKQHSVGKWLGQQVEGVKNFRALLLEEPGGLHEQSEQQVATISRRFLAWLLDVDNAKRVASSLGPAFPLQYIASLGLKNVKDKVKASVEEFSGVVARLTFVSNRDIDAYMRHNQRVGTTMAAIAMVASFLISDIAGAGEGIAGQVAEEGSIEVVDADTISDKMEVDMVGDTFKVGLKTFGKFLAKLGVKK